SQEDTEIPLDVVQYMEPRMINYQQAWFLQQCDLVISSDEPIDDVVIGEFSDDEFVRHFNDESKTLSEDVDFMIGFLSTLNEVLGVDIDNDFDGELKSEFKMGFNSVSNSGSNKTNLQKATLGLKKNSKKVSKLVNKTHSLKSDNVEETLTLKHKVLRVLIAT